MTSKLKVKNSISSSGELLLYGDIGDYWDDMDALSVVNQLEAIDSENITVRIHSPGGLVTEGLAIYNRLKESKAFVTVHIDGLAASMASVVAMAGDKIIMPDNALMMIHKPWNVAVGDAEEMRKIADSLDVLEESILKIYMTRTTLSKDDLKAMLTDETWLSADQAIEYGFADELSEPVKAVASLDLSNFIKAPENKINGLFYHGAVASNQQSEQEKPKMTKEVKPEAAENNVAENNKAESKKADSTIDAKAIAANAIAAERKRVNDIKDIGEKLSLPLAKVEEMIEKEFTIDQAKDEALNVIAEMKTYNKAPGRIDVVDNSVDIKNAISNAIYHKIDSKNELKDGREFVNHDLASMASVLLNSKGMSTSGLSKSGIIDKALNQTTSDFPNILADVSNKTLRDAYGAAPKTFEPITNTITAPDFKNINTVQLGGSNTFEKINEKGEYTYGNLLDSKETYRIYTYGTIIKLSRELIINDDLNSLMRIPQSLGRDAAEKESDLFWGLITDNGNMSDGVALFHNTHKNLGTAGALSETTLAEARKKMRKQTGLDTKVPLNLFGEYLIVPAALEVTAMKLLTSVLAQQTSNVNVFANTLKLIVEPRLDSISETAWYIAAAPNSIDMLSRAYLAGNQGVYLESEYGFDVDGMKIKARIDVGAGVLDHRGLFKNAGA